MCFSLSERGSRRISSYFLGGFGLYNLFETFRVSSGLILYKKRSKRQDAEDETARVIES
jgi:hypothetical protein